MRKMNEENTVEKIKNDVWIRMSNEGRKKFPTQLIENILLDYAIQETAEKIKDEIMGTLNTRWYWWQNFLTDAGASDYDANKLAHGCQEDIEKVRDEVKEIFSKYGVK